MTDPTIALKEYLNKIGMEADGDFLREAMEVISQMVIEPANTSAALRRCIDTFGSIGYDQLTPLSET